MKTLIFALGIILISAVPVLAGPKAVDQHGTQFHALSGLSQSAAPQPLGDKELAKVEGRCFGLLSGFAVEIGSPNGATVFHTFQQTSGGLLEHCVITPNGGPDGLNSIYRLIQGNIPPTCVKGICTGQAGFPVIFSKN